MSKYIDHREKDAGKTYAHLGGLEPLDRIRVYCKTAITNAMRGGLSFQEGLTAFRVCAFIIEGANDAVTDKQEEEFEARIHAYAKEQLEEVSAKFPPPSVEETEDFLSKLDPQKGN
jgi:hypothetical protein